MTTVPRVSDGARPFLSRPCDGAVLIQTRRPHLASFTPPSPANPSNHNHSEIWLLSGASSSKAKGKAPVTPFPSEFLPPPPAPAPRRQRQRVNVPMHQADWHWQHRQPPPYHDVTLPHDCHLDPDRIPVPAAPRTARAHAEEVRRRRVLLTPEQRREAAYATDSPNWARWFAFEHEEARRRGVREVDRSVPPALVVREEDQAALAAVYRESEDDERRRAQAAEEEEARYEPAMAQALDLSAAGDCVVPPVAPPSPPRCRVKPEPEPEPEPSPIERYSWTGVVREWVRAPPVWVGATPAQEAAYLEHWRQMRVAEERRDGEYLEMLERDLE